MFPQGAVDSCSQTLIAAPGAQDGDLGEQGPEVEAWLEKIDADDGYRWKNKGTRTRGEMAPSQSCGTGGRARAMAEWNTEGSGPIWRSL